MPTPLIFYTNPMSRGQIIRWMLEEVGVEYEERIIEYEGQMKSLDYLAINPMGKVPAIKHGENIVTECAAICVYLAESFPQANLAPTIEQQADYYRWLFFAAGPLESAITNRSLGFEVNEKQQRTAGYGNYDLTMSVLDQLLEDRLYVCGDDFTAADVYLGSQLDFGIMFNTVTETANFNAYVKRLRSRPAYIQAKKIDADLIAARET